MSQSYHIYGVLINPLCMVLFLKNIMLLPVSNANLGKIYTVICIFTFFCEFIYTLNYPLIYVTIIILTILYVEYRKFYRSAITVLISIISFMLSESLATIVVSFFISCSVYTTTNENLILITLMVNSIILVLLSKVISKALIFCNIKIFEKKMLRFYCLLGYSVFLILYLKSVIFANNGLKNQIDYLVLSGFSELLLYIFTITTIVIYAKYILEKSEKMAEKILREDIEQKLKLILTKLNTSNENSMINFKVDDIDQRFNFNDIIFFETNKSNGKVFLVTQNDTYEINIKLKNLEELLDTRFLRCHNSYIINMDKIKQINYIDCVIHMEKGECLIPKRKKMEIKEKITAYEEMLMQNGTVGII